MSRGHRHLVIASVAVIAVLALSIGLGTYLVQPNPGEPKIPSNLPRSAQTTNSSLGLELSLSLASTDYQPGESITINITEFNTLTTPNNLSAIEKDWPLSGLSLGGCGTLNYPMGIDIFQGNYGENNVSELENKSTLSIFYPGPYNCPAIFDVTNYLFGPLSNDAIIGALGNSEYFLSLPMTSLVYTNGTWSPYNGGYPGSTYYKFSPGIYTVIGGDVWGDLVILHFLVTTTPVQQVAQASSNTSSSSSSPNTAERTTTTLNSSTVTYAFAHIPQNFTLGGYYFGTSFQGMHQGSSLGSNGSTTSTLEYLGSYLSFYVSTFSTTNFLTFSWSPNANISDSLPEPSYASLFDGDVYLNSFLNQTGSYIAITVYASVPVQITATTTTETSTICTISAEPAGFFLHVVTDGTSEPIQGVSLKVVPVNSCNGSGPETTLTQSSETFVTNSSGWIDIQDTQLPLDQAFYLEFNVQYSNGTYSFSKSFRVGWAPEQGTFVTLSLPSGTVNIAYLYPTSCNGTCYFDNIPQQ